MKVMPHCVHIFHSNMLCPFMYCIYIHIWPRHLDSSITFYLVCFTYFQDLGFLVIGCVPRESTVGEVRCPGWSWLQKDLVGSWPTSQRRPGRGEVFGSQVSSLKFTPIMLLSETWGHQLTMSTVEPKPYVCLLLTDWEPWPPPPVGIQGSLPATACAGLEFSGFEAAHRPTEWNIKGVPLTINVLEHVRVYRIMPGVGVFWKNPNRSTCGKPGSGLLTFQRLWTVGPIVWK